MTRSVRSSRPVGMTTVEGCTEMLNSLATDIELMEFAGPALVLFYWTHIRNKTRIVGVTNE